MSEDNDNPIEDVMNQFVAKRIKETRKQLGISQARMAEMISNESRHNVDFSTISRWERAKVKIPGWAEAFIACLAEEVSKANTEINLKTCSDEVKNNLIDTTLNKVKRWLKGRV